jgi:hypothetical protein
MVVRGGSHELLEPSDLDFKRAIGVGYGNPPPGEGRRAERSGAADCEVDAVSEVRPPVQVWVQQREGKIFCCTTKCSLV